MIRTFRLTLLLIVGLYTTTSAQTDSLSSYASKQLPADKPGAVVLVLKDGKTLLRSGYGLANIEARQALQPDMVFRIGSITKQFTSTAILKLAEEGKIKLTENITTYLPNFKTPGGVTVTVEQLLNHTSGLKSYTSLPDVMTKENKAKAITVPAMLDLIAGKPMDFEPGATMLYNNSGYFLLGAIVEKVSGMTYEEYLAKNFFKPLGMKSTYTSDTKISKLTTGYTPASEDSFAVADYVHPSLPYSAGMIFSTVDDLARWNAALFVGKVIKQTSLDKAWSSTTTSNGVTHSYGFGWQLGRIENWKTIGHGGGIDGFVSFEMYVPDEKLYVCVLSNNMSVPTQEMSYELATRALNLTPKTYAAIPIDPSALDAYVGVYDISPAESRVIRREGNTLFSQRTGGPKYEIYPYAEDAFAFKGSDSRILFSRNSKNEVVGMQLIDRSWVPQKSAKTAKPLPAERTEISIEPAVFDPYVGEYELVPGFVIKVWREDAAFKAQATGQPAFDIYPESESRFFLKVVDALIEFKRDDQGTVSGLILFQGGREMPGKKIK